MAVNRKQVIDEYGELCRKRDEFRPTLDRLKLLEGQIQSLYDNAREDDSFLEYGDHYSVQISARKRERKIINITGLYRYLKRELFFSIARINLSDVDKLVPSNKLDAFVAETRTGKREVKPVRLAAKVAA